MQVESCKQCGAARVQGKRFCGKCGAPYAPAAVPPLAAAVQQPAPQLAAEVAPAPQASLAPPAPAPPAPPPAPPAAAVSPTLAPPPAPLAEAPQQEPAPAPVTSTAIVPDAPPSAAPTGRGKGLLIAAGVVFLVCAVGFGYIVWTHRAQFKRQAAQQPTPPAITAASEPIAVPVSAPSPASTTTPAAASRPLSSDAIPAPAPIAKPAASRATPPAVLPVASTPPASVARAETPAFQAPAPAPGGMLHYTGPPVNRGQSVVFNGLPGQRLRFIFDRNAWQATVTHQPDGTQTLTLRSLQPAPQTQCDVQWQLVR